MTDTPSSTDGERLPPLPHARPPSDADRDRFLAALDNPPEPDEALRTLMAQPQLSSPSGA